MKFTQLLNEKNRDPMGKPPVTIGFLGDSVTNGCFEVLPALTEKGESGFDVVYDQEHSYSAELLRILYALYPHAQINRINAGISGDSAPSGLERLDRDLLPFHPDLTIVCYGLNDSGAGKAGIERYSNALKGIFRKLRSAGSEVIFMTPQPIAARVHTQLRGEFLRTMAAGLEKTFAAGGYDEYMKAAKEAAAECDVPVCDCYEKWMRMYRAGVDITDLLANYLNHPTREMHRLFAASLADLIFAL